jgi:hypothetical protein
VYTVIDYVVLPTVQRGKTGKTGLLILNLTQESVLYYYFIDLFIIISSSVIVFVILCLYSQLACVFLLIYLSYLAYDAAVWALFIFLLIQSFYPSSMPISVFQPNKPLKDPIPEFVFSCVLFGMQNAYS